MSLFLVTGGAGFIGSNLVAELVGRGEHVRVFDNFSTGHKTNLKSYADQAEVIEGDIRDYDVVKKAVQGADYVLHQAALASVPRSVRDPITSNEVNVTGTLNILQAARDAGVRRLVFASSSSVYGDNPELPKREKMTPRPLSPYAISKLTGEHYCQTFWRLYGFETVCQSYFNVFGPRQDPGSQYAAVIPRFITAMLNGGKVNIYGDGTQTRDFTYIANVVQANLLACVAPGVAGRVFNIACGEHCSLLELVSELARITNREPDVTFADRRPGDILHSHADITQAATCLDYEPEIDLVVGLERTVNWFGQSDRR